MISNYVEETAVLNYINMVLDMHRIFRVDYGFGWREPAYNFYVKRYMLFRESNLIGVVWENPNGEIRNLYLRKPKYKNKFLNKLYFRIFRQLCTDDGQRAYNVLVKAVYPDFCKELDIEQVDFSKAGSVREAADLMMYAFYNTYFRSVPVMDFIEMFQLDLMLSKESIENLSSLCQCSAGAD